ncbi:spermidine/putrescine ABC transporter substrate-binding protein [Nocardioides sp. SR21]|uniref:polyamine ABC transporter substrate-binding protein n=1 Tax=Nocardioides sp. SR21 TaxID=2919501 RepID=UPI001FAA2A98|nr:spermidine/putrescine ABC transporter substrate-binding protein [Nocardioides sp. SR21]
MADPRLDRRSVLRTAALLGLGIPAAASLLQACGRPELTASDLRIASPDDPVRWTIQDDNQPIADGLSPESGPLILYNYADYVAPGVVKAFEKQYGVEVKISTFNDTDEAVQKIRTGSVPYDIYFPSYDQISRLVAAELVQPLNHTYLSNIENVWPTFQNPWYDQGWQFTVPYTVYSTGIGWRDDQVGDVATLDNPYDVLWDEQYAGSTAIIDDWHTAMAMVGLRAGITDVNTDSARDLRTISDGLSAISDATQPKVTVSMYSDLPGGQLGVSQMWSGDIVNAQYYLPKGQSVDVLRYWFPEDGKGLVDNDLMVVLKDGRCPVLAHLFIQHMLDEKNALRNFGFIGYQPPQRVLDTDRLVADGYLPENLATAAVKQEWFDSSYRLLELDVANDQAWHQVWQQFKAGG